MRGPAPNSSTTHPIPVFSAPAGQALFSRDALAFCLRPTVKALRYLHSKGLVHTQLSAAALFMNETGYVKLGGLAHARTINSKSVKLGFFWWGKSAISQHCYYGTVLRIVILCNVLKLKLNVHS